jgi:RNA polymerase sigma-70 factor (ECF subfamily)
MPAIACGDVAGADAVAEAGPSGLDEATFRAQYRVLARPLWSYLYRVTGRGSDADDLLQEVFLRYVQAPLATSEERQVRAYLYRIASNLAVDHLRRRGRESRRMSDAELTPDLAQTGDGGEGAALRHDMARSFGRLKPRQRLLLWLAYVEGSDHAEIARNLGLRKGSVPVLLFRARRALAQLLERKGWRA